MRYDQGNLHPHTTAGTRCSHETHAGGPLPSRHRRNPVLAETGDPRRFTTARAMIKHAGLVPREKLSGSFVGRTKLTRQGRPRLRLAAWRTVWGAQKANPVYAARYQYLTTREQNKLTPTQAQTVIAAAILRQLHAVITTGRRWDPDIAVRGSRLQRGGCGRRTPERPWLGSGDDQL